MRSVVDSLLTLLKVYADFRFQLNGLKTDTRSLTAEECGSSADEASQGALSSTYEQERAPSELHSFLFGHNLNPLVTDLKEFQPLPAQCPFLLDVFSENVNIFTRAVHIPSVMKMVRYSRGGGMTDLRPSHEALLFSIYYAAIVSMEEDDVSCLRVMMSEVGAERWRLVLMVHLRRS